MVGWYGVKYAIMVTIFYFDRTISKYQSLKKNCSVQCFQCSILHFVSYFYVKYKGLNWQQASFQTCVVFFCHLNTKQIFEKCLHFLGIPWKSMGLCLTFSVVRTQNCFFCIPQKKRKLHETTWEQVNCDIFGEEAYTENIIYISKFST